MAKSPKTESSELETAIEPETQSSVDETDDSQRHEQIAELAYRLWEDGGRQDGTADSDWSRAEGEYERKP